MTQLCEAVPGHEVPVPPALLVEGGAAPALARVLRVVLAVIAAEDGHVAAAEEEARIARAQEPREDRRGPVVVEVAKSLAPGDVAEVLPAVGLAEAGSAAPVQELREPDAAEAPGRIRDAIVHHDVEEALEPVDRRARTEADRVRPRAGRGHRTCGRATARDSRRAESRCSPRSRRLPPPSRAPAWKS